MRYEDFKLKTKKWNLFSPVDILGAFDFYTSIISLDSVSENDILALLSSFDIANKSTIELMKNINLSQYEKLSKILPLAIHEYTHFIDATSTLWGLNHLNLMNEAYLSHHEVYSKKESEFFKAKKFYDHLKEIRLPEYYTLINSDEENTRPWKSDLSIGRLFTNEGKISEKPIFFSRFSNANGNLLVRSPISTISILEASAMAQEIIVYAGLIQKIQDDSQFVERSNFKQKILDNYIYNPKVTEYSVCAHILANYQNCNDILIVFNLCAVLTRIVLNFPISAFETIQKNCSFSEILGIPKGHDFELVIIDGIENRNLGVLYFLLCAALPRKKYETKETIKEGVSIAISKLGINFEKIKKEATYQLKNIILSIENSEIESIAILSKAGYENFNCIDIDQNVLQFDKLNLPPVFLQDSTQQNIFTKKTNSLLNFDLEKCFNELYLGQQWVERFSEACI